MPERSPPELKVSVSQLKSYLRCPRQYELRYVRGEAPSFVPVALAFGSAFHAALAGFYKTIQLAASVPPLERLLQFFADSWKASVDGKVPLQTDEDGEEPGDQMDKAVAMLGAFHEYATKQPLPEVERVEHEFTVDIHDPETGEALEEKLAGVIDLVVREDDHGIIVEHKSAAKRWSLDQLRYDLQPTAYQFAAEQLGWGEVGLRFSITTKTRKPAMQIENILRDEQDTDDFLRTTVGVLRAIDAGAFFPVRGWQCNGCPYAHACSRRSS